MTLSILYSCRVFDHHLAFNCMILCINEKKHVFQIYNVFKNKTMINSYKKDRKNKQFSYFHKGPSCFQLQNAP